ncbi:hypothetical protein VTO58DRAFT_100758 [Aureobasidium pullulans]
MPQDYEVLLCTLIRLLKAPPTAVASVKRRTGRLIACFAQSSRTFARVNRPTPNHKRDVYFPEEGNGPEFIWLETYPEETWRLPDLESFHIPTEDTARRRIPSTFVSEIDQEHSTWIYFRDSFHHDGSKINRSINNLTSGKPSVIWKGPVVVYRQQGLDQQTFGRPVFETFFLHDRDFNKHMVHGHPSPVAHRIGLQIWSAERALDRKPIDRGVAINTMFAAILHLSCELDDMADYDIWGQSAQGWDACKEDTIVLRSDQKPLCPKYVEALYAWCRDDLQPLMLKVKEFGGSDSLKKEVVAQITQEKFEAFKEKYEKEGRTAKH